MTDMVQVKHAGGRQWDRPAVSTQRSQFDRSHGIKTTFDASQLIPILVDEVLPGDTFTCSLNGFARIFSALDAPVMDNILMDTCFFFVPTRLVWDNWEAFNGAHDAAGAQDTDFTIPVIATGSTVGLGSITHYMGIPNGLQTANVSVNSLPLRCYNLIYNEWFRNQNLIAPEVVNVDNGPDSIADYAILTSAKKHDYFTSSLPYLQKGDPVSVAFTSDAYVRMGGGADVVPTVYDVAQADQHAFDADTAIVHLSSTTSATEAQKLYADLQNHSGVSINALRESVAIQRLLERDARGGTRYVEMIKAQFGVTSPDYRLQRPEYLGGGKSYINVAPVANTSGVDSTVSISGSDEPQGELRGVGTGVISGHGWAKSFTEHGYIIGLVRARGDITYFQGLDRMWSRSTRYDFYIPAQSNSDP